MPSSLLSHSSHARIALKKITHVLYSRQSIKKKGDLNGKEGGRNFLCAKKPLMMMMMMIEMKVMLMMIMKLLMLMLMMIALPTKSLLGLLKNIMFILKNS